jgi:hypothetical protein
MESMNKMKKALLGAVTFLCPVVLAACYGPPMSSAVMGRVIDAKTKEGIAGIEVSCVIGADQTARAVSLAAGDFSLTSRLPCEKLMFRDVSAQAHGGTYADKTVPLAGADRPVAVELDKQAP